MVAAISGPAAATRAAIFRDGAATFRGTAATGAAIFEPAAVSYAAIFQGAAAIFGNTNASGAAIPTRCCHCCCHFRGWCCRRCCHSRCNRTSIPWTTADNASARSPVFLARRPSGIRRLVHGVGGFLSSWPQRLPVVHPKSPRANQTADRIGRPADRSSSAYPPGARRFSPPRNCRKSSADRGNDRMK